MAAGNWRSRRVGVWRECWAWVWQQVRQEYGVALTPTSRRCVEAHFEGDLLDYESEADMRGAAEESWLEYARSHAEVVLREAGRRPRRASPRQARARAAVRQTVATRAAEDRLRRVLEFVAWRAVPELELLRGSFRPFRGRIAWENMAKQWNRANPEDPLKPNLEQVRQKWVRAGKRVERLAAATEEERHAGSKSRRGNRSRG